MAKKNKNTDWRITTDIYDIVSMVDQTKARFIEDENETTLATGIFGFLGDTEAKKIQSSIVMTGELGNEMFPQRAKLDKNVVTHAIYCNVQDINAVPAHILINVAIKESDLDLYMHDNEFVLDCRCPIQIGDWSFHLDYDIVINRFRRPSVDRWSYSARYDMDEKNVLSKLRNAYLNQPYVMNYNNYRYVFFQCTVQQVDIDVIHDTMVSGSVIDNKSYTFTFDNQLAGFDVYITENGKRIRLFPYIYGDSIDAGTTDYCWYLFVNEDTIRIGFDQKSYVPGLSAQIEIVVYTTQGEDGNFEPKIEDGELGFYVNFTSDRYDFNMVTAIVTCASDSVDGKDKKSIDELRIITPKMAMSRGYITTETDLNNYFNLLSTKENRLSLRKKSDNNTNRFGIWYCYFILKDMYENVIPSNTLPIQIDLEDWYIFRCEGDEERYIIPCGTTFCYDHTLGYAVPIKEENIPEKFSDEYYGDLYYYRSIYNIILNMDPLYCAYYLTIMNRNSYFEYSWLNESVDVGFIATGFHWERNLLSRKKEYRITFTITQSVNEDYRLYYTETDTDTGEEYVVNNMRICLVLYNDGEPYRYVDAEIIDADNEEQMLQLSCQVTLTTDDNFDSANRIKIMDLYEAGYTTRNYGYFDEVTETYLYIYGKFEDGEYGRNGKDNLIPDMNDYTLINVYRMASGLTLFENYTNLVNTRVRRKVSPNRLNVNFNISGIPLIGEHYFLSEDNVKYLFEQIDIKRAHIDYCLLVIENNMDIDFKFFNTYGYSRTFHIGDRDFTGLGHIDISLKFRLRLVNSSDLQTRQAIIDYIKNYIEDLNGLEETDTENLHFPNLLHDIKDEFADFIIYIEYMNFNDNRLGINHIELRNDLEDVHIPREFINVRNRLDEDGNLEPCIDVEIVDY